MLHCRDGERLLARPESCLCAGHLPASLKSASLRAPSHPGVCVSPSREDTDGYDERQASSSRHGLILG